MLPPRDIAELPIANLAEAKAVLECAWPLIIEECRAVLGGELHYQALVHYCLRVHGVPRRQLGMNVKQWIEAPISTLFQARDIRKHVDYRGGFEPIPDVVVFAPAIAGDWRRRNREATLRNMLLAIEVKASERHNGRLSRGEIMGDIGKLAAHREEVRHRGGEIAPVMMVIDTSPETHERMTSRALQEARTVSNRLNVGFFYVSPEAAYASLPL